MKIFKKAAIRHLASTLLSVIISTALVQQGIVTNQQANDIGAAVGQVVGGA